MTISSNASNEKAQPTEAALFVSDLHLQASMPRTTQAFFKFLWNQATQSKQLYLLGDIFEAWAGDDDISDPYNQLVVEEFKKLSAEGVAIFWMAGNRDFLVGNQFALSCDITILPDPYVTTIANRLLVLSHGDAYCTDDIAYMQLRAKIRDTAWKNNFLALPLTQRKAIIENLRAGSREAQRNKSYDIMDVNADAIAALFAQAANATMIHGHTHKPARHEYQDGDKTRVRYVLSDWEMDGAAPRGDWLAINTDGTIHRYDVNGLEIKS